LLLQEPRTVSGGGNGLNRHASCATCRGGLSWLTTAGTGGNPVKGHFGVIAIVAAALAATAAADDQPVHLVPGGLRDGLLLNVPQRMLFVMHDGGAVASYPVGLGRPSWPTFTGPFAITAKETDPVWDVPVSIQEEMRRAGKPVLTRVLPGPLNPLGKYWLGLSAAGYGIHGTNAPRTISRFESHGCIRLRPADIEDLFARVEVGTPGLSIYEPVVLAVIDGELWMEAHPDVYRRRPTESLADLLDTAAWLAPHANVDTPRITEALRRRDGLPRRIDRPEDRVESPGDPENPPAR
jgi:L,D-transpeptidase ErfK/SrfK